MRKKDLARRKKLTTGLSLKYPRLKNPSSSAGTWSSSDDDSIPEIDEKEVEAGWDDTCDVIDTNDQDNDDDDDVSGEIDVSSLRLPDIYSCIKCSFQHQNRITFQVRDR